MDWLWFCRYDDNVTRTRQTETQVTANVALTSDPYSIPELDFQKEFDMKEDSILESDQTEQACYEALKAVVERGAVLIRRVPQRLKLRSSNNPHVDTTRRSVAVLGRLLTVGDLSHASLYGEVFDVVAMPTANNIAYTSTPLPPHQDLAYYQSPPGLQLLQCVHAAAESAGGESTLVDAVAAATHCPKWFDVLHTCPATFLKQRHNADIVYRTPHIATCGEVVSSVRWSPPFEGPVCLPADQMQDYFKAVSAFEMMVDDQAAETQSSAVLSTELQQQLQQYAREYTWQRKLERGDVLIFNNQRMLHGRRGFELAQRRRELWGCYTNMEETLSRFRLLRRRFDKRLFLGRHNAAYQRDAVMAALARVSYSRHVIHTIAAGQVSMLCL